MTDFIAGLEQDLVAAAARRVRRRPPLRTLALAAAILVLAGCGAGAGTYLVLRGATISAPRGAPPEQTAVPGSAHVAAPRAADPGGAAPWAVRVARSRTGFLCSTVGQMVGGRFGLVGLDGRFRRLAPALVDACGQERRNGASLIGARVFEARRPGDVRTVVYGVGGTALRSVTVETARGTQRIPVRGGVFVAAYRGYPEDLGIRVSLRFADGHRESDPFGTSVFVVPDPADNGAWKLETLGFARPCASGRCTFDPHAPVQTCVRFLAARQAGGGAVSEAACGIFRDARRQPGYFFVVRREVPGRPTPGFLGGRWGTHPPRTAVFGVAGRDVAAIDVHGPDGWRPARIMPTRGFLAIYGPEVRPEELTVRVTLKDGTVGVHHGDTHVVTARSPR